MRNLYKEDYSPSGQMINPEEKSNSGFFKFLNIAFKSILAFFMFGSLGASAQCTYTLELSDSWGDGWNGNQLAVTVGTNTTNYTMTSGSFLSVPLVGNPMDVLTLNYLAGGSWNTEVSFVLKDTSGAVVYSSGLNPFTGIHYNSLFCPPCLSGTLDSALIVNSNTIDLYFTESIGTLVNFQYGQSGFSPGLGNMIMNYDASKDSIRITNIFPGVQYDYYIQDSCIGSGQGAWVGPFQFTITSGAIPTGFNQNFDAFTLYLASNNWPDGWSANPATTANSYTARRWLVEVNQPSSGTVTGPAFDHTSGNGSSGYIYWESSSGTGTTGDVYSPYIDLDNSPIKDFSFWYHMHGQTMGDMIISVDSGDGVLMPIDTLLGSIESANFSSATSPWLQKTYNLAQYSSGFLRVAFTSIQGSSFYSDMAFDDVMLGALGGCLGASVSLVSSDLTSATFSWDNPTTNDTVYVEYGPPGFAIGTGTVVAIDSISTPITISGLATDEEFEYFYWKKCGSVLTPISSVGAFNTLIGADCGTARTISSLPYVGDTNVTQGYGNNYLQYAQPCNQFYSNGEDHFYVYTATQNNLVEVEIQAGSPYAHFYVLDACYNDPNANCIAYGNNFFSGNPSISNILFEAGKTYYIIVDNYSTSYLPGQHQLLINIMPDEAAITSIDNPVNPVSAGFASVDVTIDNQGGGAITSLNLGYTKNGITQAPYSVTFNPGLVPADDTTITIGGTNFPTTPTDIVAYISTVNGMADGNQGNDTIDSRFCGPISGTFTVGGAGATFATLGQAVEALDCGINGPVVFNIAPGTYNENIVLGEVVGASATNTITFDGGSAATTSISFNPSTTDQPVVYINGGDYYILTNLTIENLWTSTDCWGVFLENDAHDNTIDNCVITMPNSTSSDRACIVASNFTSSATSSGNNTSNITITNNTLEGAWYGIALRGTSSTNRNPGVVIENNNISANRYGIYTYYMDTMSIKNNVFTTHSNPSIHYGLYLYYADDVVAEANDITSEDVGVQTFTGNSHRYVNNMIKGGNDRGFFLNNVDNVTMLHNSIFGNPGFEHQSGSSEGLTFRNNIFASENDFGFETNGIDSADIVALDYNIYYSANGSPVEFDLVTYDTLANLQAAAPYANANSIIGDPVFNSNTDLHITFGLIADSAGTPVGVIKDIDGDGRYFLAPDIGADEYDPITKNLALESGFMTNTCVNGVDSLTFYVVNEVLVPIDFSSDNFTLTANVSGVSTGTQSVTVNSGTLNPGDSLAITLSPFVLNVQGAYTIDAYISSTWDVIADNDTLFGGNYSVSRPVATSPDTAFITLPSQTANLLAPTSNPVLLSEDFSGQSSTNPIPSGWSTDRTSAPYWTYDNNSTGSSSTGPSGGNVNGTPTFGNAYIFLETSGASPANVAQLVTPPVNLTGITSGNLSFWYHMYGNTMGTLEAQVSIDGGTNWTSVFVIQGQQQSSSSAPWINANVSLSPFANETITVRFLGSGTSFRSDMALDDIEILNPGTPSVVWWDSAGVAIDSTYQVNVGPFTVADNGFKSYIHFAETPCGTFSDTSIVAINIIPDEVAVNQILSPAGGCKVDTTFIEAEICNNGSNAYSNLPVYADLNGVIITDTLDTLAPYSCDTILFSANPISILSIDTTLANVGVYVSVLGDVDNSNDTNSVSNVVYTSPPSAPMATNDTVCTGETAFLTGSSSPGINILWYDAPTGGNLILVGDTLTLNPTENDTVYAQAGGPFGFTATSPLTAVPAPSSPVTVSISNLPTSASSVNLTVYTRGDFSFSGENLDVVDENSNSIGLTGFSGDCQTTYHVSNFTISITDFNNFVADGVLELSFNSSSAVNPNLCANNDFYYEVSYLADDPCSSPSRTMAVAYYNGIAIDSTKTADQSNCLLTDGTIDVFATDENATIGGTIQYSIDGGTTFQSSGAFTGLANNAFGYDVVVTDGFCTTTGPNLVINKPGAPSAPGMPANFSYCQGDTLLPLFIDSLGLDSGVTQVKWYSDPSLSALSQIGIDSVSPIDTVGTITYYATQVLAGCEGTAGSVDVTINMLPPDPILSSDTTVCMGEMVTLSGTTPVTPPPFNQQVGSGFSTNSRFPIYSCYGYNYSQNIYLQSEVGGTGLIDKIYYYYTSGGTNFAQWQDWVVYLGHTSKSSFSGTTDWVPFTDLTEVFNGVIATPVGNNWFEITLSNPFFYNGTDNLVVAVDENTPNWSCTANFRAYNSGSLRGLLYYSDPINPNPASPPTANFSSFTIAQAQFNITPATSFDWYGDAGLSNLIGTGVNITAYDTLGAFTYYANYVDGNGCYSGVDSVTVTKQASPNAPTVANQVYCDGDTLMPFSITGSGGTYNVYTDMMLNNQVATGVTSFTSGLLNPGFQQYWFTEVNATGCESPASMASITINAVPASANLSGNTTNYCQGDSLMPLSSGNIPGTTTIWYSDAAGTTQLGTGSIAPSNTIGSTTYYAELSNGLCASPIDSITVTINAIPGAPAVAGGATYCDGDMIMDLMATGTGNGFTWYSDAALSNMVGMNANYTPGNIIDTVTYYATQSLNGCESAVADSATVIIHGNPSINLVTSDSASACNTTDGWIEIVASGGDGSYLYSVDGGATTTSNDSITGLATGNYTPYVEDGNGCSDVSSVVTINAPGQPLQPSIIAGSGTYCQGDAYTALQVVNTTLGQTYNWYYDAGLSSLYMSGDSVMPDDSVGSITYYVTANASGCEGPSASVTVNINPIPGAPAGGSDLTYCLGEPVGNASASANTGGSLTWYSDNGLSTQIGTGNSVAAGSIAILPGTYSFYVTETVSGCESGYDSVNVTINPIPNTPNAGMDMVYCDGDMLMPLVGTGTGGILNWYSDGQLSNNVGMGDTLMLSSLPVGTTTFWLAETNSFGCEGNSDNVNVTVNPTPMAPSIAGAMDYCDYDMVDTLSAVGMGGTYTWYSDYTTAVTGMMVVPPSTVGQYNFMLTETNQFGCESDSGMATVNVFESPTIDSLTVVDVTGGCADSTGSITVNVSGGDSNYMYYGNIFGVPTANGTSNVFGNLPAGTYDSLYVVDGNGCVSGTDMAEVSAPGQPSLLEMVSADVDYCFGDAVNDLVAQDTSASTAGTIEWYTNSALTNLVGTGDSLTPGTALGTVTYYAVENNLGCKGPAATVTVTVNALPATPNTSGNVQYCDGDVINDIYAVGAGGTITWYSDAALTTVFASGDTTTPSITAPGQEVLYVVETDTNGCTSAIANDILITVDTLPTVMISPLADVCENGGTIQLMGAMPMGGTWSADSGVTTAGVLDPIAIGGSGTYNVTYSYTDGNGCSADDTESITVNPEPVVTFSGLADLCIDGGSFAVAGGIPMGGTYTGVGVDTAGNFDPTVAGAGTSVLTYTYTDANNCTSSDIDTIEVFALPTPNAGVDQTICFGDMATLVATGGASYMWSNSVGNDTNTVMPSATTTYGVMVTDGNGCSASDSVTVNVDALPVVNFTAPNSVCEGAAPVVLSTATPAGGTYSGTGVSFGIFNPNVGAGSYTLTYSYTDPNTTCSNTDTTLMIVDTLPSVTFATPNNVCADAAAVTLTGGAPAGGTYAGTGVTGTQFDPAAAGGAGTYNLTYSFTDGNGCSNSVGSTITVDTLPTISWVAFADVCDNAPAVTLTEASPAGGQYSGTGVSGGQFDAAAAGGAGSYAITYDFTDGNGCSATSSQNITVNPSPVVNLGNDTTLCNNIPTIVLDAGTGVSYVWSKDGTPLPDNTQTITVDGATGSGDYTVEVTNTFGCAGVSNTININYTEICPSVNTVLGDDVSITYYPNPTSGLLNVDIDGLAGENITLTITNMHGQQVFNTFIENAPLNIRDVIDLSGEATGIYFIRLTAGDQSFVQRISLR